MPSLQPDPSDQLRAGAEMLADIFEPLGMRFAVTEEGRSSSGRVAIGYFSSPERSVELHYRFGLCIVRYRFVGPVLDHEEFMRAAGVGSSAEFPVVNDMTLRGFEALRSDLLNHGHAFLAADRTEWRAIVAEARRNPKPKGFKGLGR